MLHFSVTGNCTAGQMIVGKTCRACPLGTYQDRKWQTECKRCGDKMTTSRKGATTIRDCLCRWQWHSANGSVPFVSELVMGDGRETEREREGVTRES